MSEQKKFARVHFRGSTVKFVEEYKLNAYRSMQINEKKEVIRDLMDDLAIEVRKAVIFIGGISDDRLDGHIRGKTVYIYVSDFEGNIEYLVTAAPLYDFGHAKLEKVSDLKVGEDPKYLSDGRPFPEIEWKLLESLVRTK